MPFEDNSLSIVLKKGVAYGILNFSGKPLSNKEVK